MVQGLSGRPGGAISENVLALRLRSETLCDISPVPGPGVPERVGRDIVFQFSIYSLHLAVDRLTGGDRRQVPLRESIHHWTGGLGGFSIFMCCVIRFFVLKDGAGWIVNIYSRMLSYLFVWIA